ncbi:S8 family serine peptidase [Pseudobdellovibrio sp. HCB154]|uniref:S8 family serine peptidase n=1 Tax=Pseudobdellovibrio sp. HCB154 TaxID=3386277 RepID=UPI003916F547
MRTKLSALVLLAASLGLSVSANAGEYLVKYKNEKAVNNIVFMQTEANGLQVKSMHKPGKLLKVSVNEFQKVRVLAEILRDKNVEYVVPNFKIKAFSAPADITGLKEQYALAKVNAPQAWAKAGNKGKKSVTVAVIDTGIDYNHSALAPNMVKGFDFRDNDADPMDLTGAQNPGHGTHCGGIIGATGLVDGGIQGISPEVQMMPIRFLGADGSGDLDNGIKSIDYAIEKGVQVISASWGAAVPKSQAQPLIEAVQRADAAGIIFVAAAANDGKNNDNVDMYPTNANTANMIAVAASNSNDTKPYWSNYGKAMVSIAAPGDAIMSTLPGNKYGNLSGTSMATPLVAGLVAFLKAQDPSLTGAEIRSLMQATGAKVQIETACNCRIDALASVNALLDKQSWMVPAATTLAVDATQQFTVKNAQGAVKFESSDANIATISESGLLTAKAQGTVTVKGTDASGNVVSSLDINVGKAQSSDPGNPGDGECPLGDPMMCQIMCGIMPELPFCQ